MLGGQFCDDATILDLSHLDITERHGAGLTKLAEKILKRAINTVLGPETELRDVNDENYLFSGGF